MTLSLYRLTRSLLLLALLAVAAHPAAAQPDPNAEARVAAALAEAHGEAVPTGLARSVAGALSQEQKLTASDAAGGDFFGWSVSLSGDRALVGAIFDDDGGSQSGSAYIFARDGSGAWSQEAKLTASDAAQDDLFGYSVSLDGDRALVGAYLDGCFINGFPFVCGSVYVFAFDGAMWSQEAKLTASDAAAFDDFGFSVTLTGERALIGATGDDNDGSAYVFAFDGTSWVETTKLTASDAASNDNFGFSVSLSGDRALVGATGNDCAAGVECGSAYVFAFDGAMWSEEARLTASDADQVDVFGISVSLSGDRALVGAYLDDDDGNPDSIFNSGSAYVFDFDGTTWSETAKLTASDAAQGDYFGQSVSLSGDRALIGAPVVFNVGSGSAYVFAFDGAMWSETAKLTASDAAGGDQFGFSVSLDGDRALVGARSDDSGSGSAYVFGPAPPLDLIATSTTPLAVAPGGSVGFAYALDNNTAASASGQLWFNARTSGGATVAQAVILSGTLPAGASQSGSYTQPIPGNAPAGAYTYCLRLGVFPNTIVDEACFTLTVTGTARAAGPAAWSVRDVTPWEHAGTEDVPEASSTTGLPASLALEAAYPNPFAAQAVIGYAVPEATEVRLVVYDLLGRTVAVLAEGRIEAGRHEAVLDGAVLPSGTYLVRLDAGGAVQTQRLTLVR